MSFARGSRGPLLVPGFVLLLSAACAVDAPTGPLAGVDQGGPALAKPPSCPAQIAGAVTGLSGSLLDDGGGVYAAHLNGVNGRLSFNVDVPRTVTVTTSAGAVSTAARIYTNTHELTCGLSAMNPAGSTGTGVLEIEWSDATNRYTLRYGKNCVGDFGTVVPANLISTARSGNVWTLSGDAGEGILCRGRLNGKPNWSQIGTGDAFSLTFTG